MNLFSKVLLILSFLLTNSSAMASELWKGPARENSFQVGGLLGLGLSGRDASSNVLLSGSTVIAQDGFIDDINERAWLDLEIGPNFFTQGTGFVINALFRMDFTMNDSWTFFAAGGLGSTTLPKGVVSTDTILTVYPHIVLGAFYRLTDNVSLKMQVSHALTAFGVSIDL
ncbi:MAG: hypothetical protein K2X47_10270 [Bdellovibrionales bacterium]|nr:hypothetical protein [Bdellovibrionales bacterium]